MSEVVVVAVAKVKTGQEELVQDALLELATASHAEEGCVKYTIHRSNGDRSVFTIVERWASQEALDAHFLEPHVAGLQQAVELLEEPPIIHFCTPLGPDGPKGVL